MKKQLSLSEIQDEIAHLPSYFDEHLEPICVTHLGKPVMAILPWKLYESLIETLEVMSDPELMAAFRQSVQELNEGKGRLWEDVNGNLRPS